MSIYLRDTIKFQEIEKTTINHKVHWVCVSIGEQNLKISGVYKPPNYDNNDFLANLESILIQHPKRHIIVGDININLLNDSNLINNCKKPNHYE